MQKLGVVVDYDYLKHATYMSLSYSPKTEQAKAFDASIAALLKANQTRQRKLKEQDEFKFDKAVALHGYDCSNAFSKTFFPEEGNVSKRNPIPIENIRTIQSKCMEIDDDMRWLIALISDTGMRLGEAVGLLKEDIILEDEVPHVRLIPHSWRRLKTKGSQRDIPLVGASLWACKRLLENNTDSIFAFPRYCNEKTANANSASGALNKWLQEYVPEGCVIHSFRHSMRDRLRAASCPSDMIDQIGSWTTAGVGQGYGEGYGLGLLQKFMLGLILEKIKGNQYEKIINYKV